MNKLRKIVALILVFAVVSSIVIGNTPFSMRSVEAATPNLVQNPGFETGTTAPDKWVPYSTFANLKLWDNIEKYEGEKSLKLILENNATRSIYDQNVTVVPGETYSFSTYCKVESWTGDAAANKPIIYFDVFDSKNALVISKSIAIEPTTTEWAKVSIPDLTMAANASYVRIRLMLLGGTGSVWFDNVDLHEVVQQLPENLESVTLNIDKADLLTGESANITVSGMLFNGSDADLSTAQISINNSNPSVVEIHSGSSNTNFTALAIQPGAVNIKAIVRLNNVPAEDSVAINVTGLPLFYNYSFRNPLTASIAVNNWQLIPGQTVPCRDQAYGTQIQSSALGQELSFQINVPETGIYTLKLDGAGAAGGAIGAMLIDGQEAGTYDFYLAAYSVRKGPVSMRTFELSQGIHTLTFRTIGRTTGAYDWSMYPGELRLTRQQSLPSLNSIKLEAQSQDITVGQQTIVKTVGSMSDGFDYDLNSMANATNEFTSSDTTVATVDQSGLVQALKAGTSTISTKVTYQGITLASQTEITVSDKKIGSVTLSVNKSNLVEGQTANLVATAKFDDGSDADISTATKVFSTTTDTLISVDANTGAVTALQKGTASAHVEVSMGGITKAADLEIIISSLELKEINVAIAKTSLKLNETATLNVTGKMSDGTAANLGNAAITYISSNPSAITVENGVVAAVAPGSAIITTNVALNGVVISQAIEVIVVEKTISYNFKLPVANTLEQNSWKIVDHNITGASAYRNQAYGIQIQSTAVGQYLTMDFIVPEAGIYTIGLNGAGAGSGALATILIDGQEVGEYDFYSSAYVVEKGIVTMRTYELAEGVHKLTFKVKAKKGYYNMYPGTLVLMKVSKLKTLETMELTAAKNELMVGQTSLITMQGRMSDGFIYNLNAMNSIVKTAECSDTTVATIDENGKATALKPGTVVYSASAQLDGVLKQNTISLTVNNKVLSRVELTSDKTQIAIGGPTAKLSVKGLLDDNTTVDLSDANIVFSTTTKDLVAVSESGIVSPLLKGSANAHVDVTLGSTTRSADLVITVKDPELYSTALSMYKSNVFIGDILQPVLTGIFNTGKPADLTGASVVYTSSNPNVVSVNDNKLSALSAGTAKITAAVTLDTVTKSCETTVTVNTITSSKTRSTIFTPEKIANAIENSGKYTWASNARDGVVSKADSYIALGYEYLWNSITPQSIPRSYAVNQELGSPVTGKEIDKFGNYPYQIDVVNKPWKIKDPSSGYYFPTNDFESYYKSGLDEHGIFNPNLADKKYLVNELYPEKGASWGVDDGYGWIDDKGKKYTFIAYYNHFGLWYSGFIDNALTTLTDAYAYSGDIKYAEAGLVMLDRIADLYPDMTTTAYPLAQGFKNSDGGSGLGKVLGCIWETSLVTKLVRAYDAFFAASDNANVTSFLSGKGVQYKLGILKNSPAGIRRNIEDNIVRQVYPNLKAAYIRGNNGMHQNALATAAVVLDTMPETKEWLDFTFQAGAYVTSPTQQITGGNIKATLVNDIDRDGHGSEASPGYNKLWITQFLSVADVLDGYDRYPDADLYKDVKFRKMFSAMYPLMMSDVYGALIGDTGTTGGPLSLLDRSQAIKAYEKFGDPIFAQLVHYINNYSTTGIHSNIFAKDPEAIAQRIQDNITQYGPLELDSSNLTGYGFTALRDGANFKRYFGNSIDFLKMEVSDTNTAYKVFDASNTLQLEPGSDASAIGKYITFKFTVDKTDFYEVDINPFKSVSYGIYSVKLDGNYVRDIDFYGLSGASSKLEYLTKAELATGEHTITFECIGYNNTGANNYKMGVISLVLFDEAALAIRDGESSINAMRDLWMYYGRNGGHGHRDTLNIGMHAFGLDLAPELGYPETADGAAHRHEWVNNTISHNTVVVNQSKQNESIIGLPQHFDDGDLVKLIDVKAPKAYTSTQDYRRTTAMIKVDDENSYYVDFFRIVGGNDHQFSFHSTDGTVSVEGLDLVPQVDANGQYIGSYAGSTVPFGSTSTATAGYTGSGFHWLQNVDRDTNPDSIFSVDWDIKDNWDILRDDEDVHLRLTMLGNIDEVSLADGIPPRNKGVNPASLRYMIARRSGTDLSSNFTSVIEPYKNNRYVQSITPATLKVGGQVVDSSSIDAKAIKVTLANGRIDYIVYSVNADVLYTVDDKFSFKGFFGVYSEWEGTQIGGYVNDGTVIGPMIPEASKALTGKVVSFTETLSIENEIRVSIDQAGYNAEDLIGRYIYVENDNVRNGSYKITGVTSNNDGTVTLDIGDITTIRQWKDTADFSKGYIYDIAKNAAFRIPLSTEYKISMPIIEVSIDKSLLERGQTANISITGALDSGEAIDISKAIISYTSSNPEAVQMLNGVVTAYGYGSSEITVVVKLYGATLTKVFTVEVTVNPTSIKNTIAVFEASGDLQSGIIPQLVNSIDQAEHQLEIGDKENAIKHLQDAIKHLMNRGMQKFITPEVKEVLIADLTSLIAQFEK